jgi:hypothetical protein
MNVLLRGLFVFFTVNLLAPTVSAQVVDGSYNGLFLGTNEVSAQNSGSFSLTTFVSGNFSGKLMLSGTRILVKGMFDTNGNASAIIPRRNLDPLHLELHLSVDANNITGFLSTSEWSAMLAGDRAVFSRISVTPQAGRYTMIIPGSYGSTNEPAGDGYATVSVDSAGNVNLAGALADGTKFSQGSVESGDGRWPLCVWLYGNKGLVIGWIAFTNEPGSDLSGGLNWIKPAGVKPKFYPAGFTTTPAASGVVYHAPAKGMSVMDLVSGAVEFEGGNLTQSITNHMLLDDLNRVRNLSPNLLNLQFTFSNGAFQGKAKDPATSKMISFAGVVLQGRNIGRGFFPGANLCGSVRLSPEVADVVEFQTLGGSFAADVQWNSAPEIFRWLWADGTSASTYPTASKKFKTKGARQQFLVAYPPGALNSINIGFDASDGGTNTPLTFWAEQNVDAVNFPYALPGLKYWASSYNPIVSLDFSGFNGLEVIECFHCTNLLHVAVTNLPSLERACFEDCDLQELDLTGDPQFEDLRAALNNFNAIIVGGGTGPKVWHWCTRDNEQLGQDFHDILPDFPSLRELWNWGDKQSGSFPVYSTNLTDVQAESNSYTDADFSGEEHLVRCWLYNNSLTNLVLDGCVGLLDVDVHNNRLTQPVVDNLLFFLESVVANSPGQLKFADLTENAEPPSDAGYAAYTNILNAGVSIYVDGR